MSTQHHVLANRAPRSRWAAIGAAIAVTLGAGGVLTGSAASGTESLFVPIAPCRLADTRPGTDNVGPRATPLAADETYTPQVHGTNGRCTIPATATAISLNVTVANPSAASFLTVFPPDQPRPLAASLNWVAGQAPTPNAVTGTLSADGRIGLYNLSGTVDVIADIVGYYVPGTGSPGPAGPTGPTGPAGPQGPAGQVNRLSDEQIALLQWYDDPGSPAIFPVGDNPAGIAFDGSHLWVANLDADTVSKVDPVTGAATAYPVGDGPFSVAYDGTSVWVTNSLGNTVSRIVPATGASTQFATGVRPHGIAFDGTSIWIANNADDTVGRMDPLTGAMTTFPVQNSPTGVAYDGTSIWVANNDTGSVSQVDPLTGAATHTAVPAPVGVAFDGYNIWITSANSPGAAIRWNATAAVATAFPLTGAEPYGVAYDGNEIWVTDVDDDAVFRIDPRSASSTREYPLGAGTAPRGVAFDGTNVWIVLGGIDAVARLIP